LDDADLLFPTIDRFNELMKTLGDLSAYRLVKLRQEFVGIHKSVVDVAGQLKRHSLRHTAEAFTKIVERRLYEVDDAALLHERIAVLRVENNGTHTKLLDDLRAVVVRWWVSKGTASLRSSLDSNNTASNYSNGKISPARSAPGRQNTFGETCCRP
jgi:hypothetical protein